MVIIGDNLEGEGDLVVRTLDCCNLEVPGSNPPPRHLMDLCSVVPNSTPPRLFSSQLVRLLPDCLFNKFLPYLKYFSIYVQCPQLAQQC